MFHTALTCPDITCCWPIVEVSPFLAAETNKYEVVDSTTARRSAAYVTGVKAKKT
jgi:hypothetical protein